MKLLDSVRRFFREVKEFVKGNVEALFEESVSALEGELLELESAFLFITLGPLVGVKTITPLLSLELLDAVKDEIRILLSRAYLGEDVLGDLMSALGGEW
jgi:hypothetical protein